MDSRIACLFRNIRYLLLVFIGFSLGIVLMYISLIGKMHTFKQMVLMDTGPESENDQENICSLLPTKCQTLPTKTPHSSFSNESWEFTQRERRQSIRASCSPHNNQSQSPEALHDNDNIIVDAKHKIIFCAIPKAACSSWRMAMTLLTNKTSKFTNYNYIHSPLFLKSIGLPAVTFLNQQQITNVIKSFTKFLVVRHPLERLVSAYRDKFQTYNKYTRHFQHRYGRKIVALYRGNGATKRSLQRGHDVTFREFLTFILDEAIPIEDRANPHWDTYQNLCHPCLVDYDYVIKFETLAADNEKVLSDHFDVDNSEEFFPKRNAKNVPSRELMLQYYSTVPSQLLKGVYLHYKADLDIFGYTIPQEIWDIAG